MRGWGAFNSNIKTMRHGKTIKIFLIEGDPNGRMTCELSNWTGKAYKIPRILVSGSDDRSDLKNTGIYLLFGKNEAGMDKVYIGEAESVLIRLKQQLSAKEYWNEAIVFVSKDDNLNKAHVKYLENRLYEQAKKAGRFDLDNASIPTQSSISESDRAEMEEFLENIRLLVNTLGHKVFEEKREVLSILNEPRISFFIKGVREAEAQGQRTTDGFVVFKGSKASKSVTNAFSPSFVALRDRLIESHTLTIQDKYLLFQEDYIFSSPSAAAMIVLGTPTNGLSAWKDAQGRTLKTVEAEDATEQNLRKIISAE